MAMRRKILGKTPAEIKMIKREDVDLPVTAEDFKDAMSKTRKSVSEADVKNFENWMAEVSLGTSASFERALTGLFYSTVRVLLTIV